MKKEIIEKIENEKNLDKSAFRITILDALYTLQDMEEAENLTEKEAIKILEEFEQRFSIYDWDVYVKEFLRIIIEDIEYLKA